MRLFLIVTLAVVIFQSCQTDGNKSIKNRMVINSSMTMRQDSFYLNGADSLDQPVIIIEGDNIEVDFNNAVLIGSKENQLPNDFSGLGILIRNGSNITIKNLTVRGYKVGILADNVKSLTIENIDLSYNYRQQLKSTRKAEHLDDWLSYDQNDNDEWLRYGAAIYLKKCDSATVKDITVHGGQNGLMVTKSNDGLFYNNTIQFNSGVGIGLYKSSRNKVMHNRLDFNVRGYSHSIYQRGQGSASILMHKQNKKNTIAYNSATHSSNIFLDSVAKGFNDNTFFENDFAPTLANKNDALSIESNIEYNIPTPIPDGQDAMLPENYQYRGHKFILVNEWGPYDFQRPALWLREVQGDDYIFALLSQPRGNFKLVGGQGFTKTSVKSGAVPTTVVVKKSPDIDSFELEFDFFGEEIITQFGKRLKKGTPYKITYKHTGKDVRY